jgi:5-methylcytosine-specific restriction endonuclease McrA
MNVAETLAHVEAEQLKREAAKAARRADDVQSWYRSWEWARVRYAFLRGKERRCQCCGLTPADGIKIVVDHVKPIRHFWHLRADPTNLQLLCDTCNRGKGSHDETDWRAGTTTATEEKEHGEEVSNGPTV